jgi:hypothetical protein
MKNGNGNGKHVPLPPQPKGGDIAKLLRHNNALLVEVLGSLLTIQANLQTVMLYLPACASGNDVSRDASMRICQASDKESKRLFRLIRKRLKESGV